MVKSFKLKAIKSALIRKWVQFCLNTSLHGWKYFALPKISRFERCAWYIVCIATLSISIYLLASAWSKFHENPTIIVTESTQHPIYKYEFPAVTVCSLNKISKSAAFQLARKLEPNSSNVEWLANSFRLFLYLLSYDNHDPPVNDSMKLLEILKRNGLSEEVFHKISPPCSRLLKKCFWKGEDQNCDILFEEVKTVIGYCCSFNYFARKNGTKTSSAHSHRKVKQPRRTSSCGYQTGLELLIDNDPENYFATLVPSVGYNVLIHNPYDFPDEAVQIILCEMNTNNFIGINPEIIAATKNIRSKSIAARKCLFASEKKLDYFSKYTFNNCMAECKIELIARLCNCTPFYIYDNTRSYGNTKLCSFEDFKCILHNAPHWYNMSLILESKLAPAGKCDCLPTCDSTNYIPESSRGILDSFYSTNMFSVVSGMETRNHTLIRVFFNDLLGTRHRRDVLFTWHMLMGSYGGILGLFTGFSFMLVVEIIYHFLVRPLKDDKVENR